MHGRQLERVFEGSREARVGYTIPITAAVVWPVRYYNTVLTLVPPSSSQFAQGPLQAGASVGSATSRSVCPRMLADDSQYGRT